MHGIISNDLSSNVIFVIHFLFELNILRVGIYLKYYACNLLIKSLNLHRILKN
jgi:hypothetical protein